MNATVEVLELKESEKNNVLASATVKISLDANLQITIADFRVLRNKQGGLWIAPPSRAVQLPASRSFEYHPVVVLSRTLQRETEDKILAAFAHWQTEQQNRD
jgi:DNA-binding cell septation regulator SpoVG